MFRFEPHGHQEASIYFVRNDTPKGPCGSPQWSSMGDTVLFQTGETLLLLNVDTGGRRIVVDRLTQDVSFRWSPDGTRIVYARPVSPDEGQRAPSCRRGKRRCRGRRARPRVDKPSTHVVAGRDADRVRT